MKLFIKRSQIEGKGLFGGRKGVAEFLLSCHVELTQEEQNLFAKYREVVAREEYLVMEGFADASQQGYIKALSGNQSGILSVADLLEGKTIEYTSIHVTCLYFATVHFFQASES